MTTILIENISKSFGNPILPKENSKVEKATLLLHQNKKTLVAPRINKIFLLGGLKKTKNFVLKKFNLPDSLLSQKAGVNLISWPAKMSKTKNREKGLQQAELIVRERSSDLISDKDENISYRGFTKRKTKLLPKHSFRMYTKNTQGAQSTQALREIYLEIPKGAITVLVGGSGSGKSTLLRIIAGLDKPDQGSIWLNGRNANSMSVQERGIGFVAQGYALFPHMTVYENIAFGLRVKKELPFQIETRCQYLLKLIQLSNLAGYYPSQLSGGQKQRVALARALAPDPKLLLLDEPFAALDMRMRKELRDWIYTLQKQSSVTIVLVTHDYKEALEIATNIVMLKNGRIEQLGHPVDFYDYFLQKRLL